MTVTSVKSLIWKEDLSLQTNTTTTAETFERKTSAGGVVELEKFPDIWGGKGCVNTGKVLVKAADSNTTVLHSFGDIT